MKRRVGRKDYTRKLRQMERSIGIFAEHGL